jgi:hypothetical protein
MRKIKEILRLHFEHKLGQRQIARSAGVSQSTVHDYLTRMKAAGLNWPLSKEWDEERIEHALFAPGQSPARPSKRMQPDFPRIRIARQGSLEHSQPAERAKYDPDVADPTVLAKNAWASWIRNGQNTSALPVQTDSGAGAYAEDIPLSVRLFAQS